MSLLKITDLHARIEGDGREILKGISLEIQPGEVHAIMGVNGSGKSTLANILGGKDGYEVTSGSITFDGKELLELDPEVRAREGLFLAFQYPVELPGVLTTYFLRTAMNSVREHRGLPAMSVRDFSALVKEKASTRSPVSVCPGAKICPPRCPGKAEAAAVTPFAHAVRSSSRPGMGVREMTTVTGSASSEAMPASSH